MSSLRPAFHKTVTVSWQDEAGIHESAPDWFSAGRSGNIMTIKATATVFMRWRCQDKLTGAGPAILTPPMASFNTIDYGTLSWVDVNGDSVDPTDRPEPGFHYEWTCSEHTSTRHVELRGRSERTESTTIPPTSSLPTTVSSSLSTQQEPLPEPLPECTTGRTSPLPQSNTSASAPDLDNSDELASAKVIATSQSRAASSLPFGGPGDDQQQQDQRQTQAQAQCRCQIKIQPICDELLALQSRVESLPAELEALARTQDTFVDWTLDPENENSLLQKLVQLKDQFRKLKREISALNVQGVEFLTREVASLGKQVAGLLGDQESFNPRNEVACLKKEVGKLREEIDDLIRGTYESPLGSVDGSGKK